MKLSVVAWTVIILAGVSIGSAQQDTLKQEGRISTSETLLTREDFKRLACENVGDALRNITGVYVRNGQIALRDVAADKVVILLDGQRLNTAQGGGVDVITLPIDIVETIEVVRGGQSALYGADAVGGVIIITTRGKSSDETRSYTINAHSTIASFSTNINGIDFSQRLGAFNYLLSYKRTSSRGDFTYEDPVTGRDTTWLNNDQSINDWFLKTSYALDTLSSLSLSGSYYNAGVGAPGLIDQQTPYARLGYNNKNLNLSYDRANLFGDFNLKVQTYLLWFQLKYDNPVGIVQTHSTHNNDATSVEVQQAGSVTDFLQLSYGYTFRQDRLNSTDIGKKKRNNHAAYGTVTLSWREFPVFFQEVALTPALRYDYPSDFTPELSPKVTLTMKHTSWLSLSLISHLTRSYRAPTFNDLYWPKDSFSEGNPNLVPETGINWDAGLSFTFPSLGDLTLTGNYFINNMNNLILWAPGADGLWRPNNISKTESYGIETATRWKPLGEYVELAFDYTYMVALDKSDSKATYDKDLIYRPRNKFSATLTLRFGGVEMNALDHYVGKRYTTASNTKSLEAYNVVDANIGYSFWVAGLRFSAKFEVNNLTDLSYFPIEGSPVPGREFRFTVGVTI